MKKNVVFGKTKIGVRTTEFLTLHRLALLWKRTDIRTVLLQLTPLLKTQTLTHVAGAIDVPTKKWSEYYFKNI